MRACVSCDQFVDVATSRCPKCSLRLLPLAEFRMPDMASPKDGRSLLDARIGTVLGGEWVVDGVLGEGGDGIVYRAHNRKTGVLAAAKRQRSAADQRVDGPNVLAQVGSAAGADGRRFALFEFCSAGSLRDLLDRMRAAGQQLTTPQAIEALKQITRGLLVYHGRGLVHGDLKPENVMVAAADDGSAQLKLGDPLAPEDVGKSRGSPPYAAPEVCDGGVVTAKADLWALGVIAQELLTGELPFDATGRAGMVQQVVSDTVVPMPLPKGTKSRLRKLVRALLSRDPGERPDSPREVLVALDQVEADPEEWQRRGSVGIAALGALVLILALVFGGGTPSELPKPPLVPPPVPTPVPTPVIPNPKPVQPSPEQQRPKKLPTLKFTPGNNAVASASDGKLYVDEGADLVLEFKVEQPDSVAASLGLKVEYRRSGDPKFQPVDGAKLTIEAAKLGKADGVPRTFEYQVKWATDGAEWVERSVAVVVLARSPKATADGVNVTCSACGGFTKWSIGDGAPKPVTESIPHECEEWSLSAEARFYVEVDQQLRNMRTASVEWVGPSRAKLRNLQNLSELEVDCLEEVDFFLTYDDSASSAEDASPLPRKTLSGARRVLNLREALRNGLMKGRKAPRLVAKNRNSGEKIEVWRDGSVFQEPLQPDPFQLFGIEELVQLGRPQYRVRLALDGGASGDSRVEAWCKVDLKLPGLVVKIPTEPKSSWKWVPSTSELLATPLPALESRKALEIPVACQLVFGDKLQEYPFAAKMPYGPEPFLELVRLANARGEPPRGGRDESSLIRCVVISLNLPDEEFVNRQTKDWSRKPLDKIQDRSPVPLAVGLEDLVKIGKWLNDLLGSPAATDVQFPSELRGSILMRDPKKIEEYLKRGEKPLSEATNAVEVVWAYALTLNWASGLSGSDVRVEPATLLECLLLEDVPAVKSAPGLLIPRMGPVEGRPGTEVTFEELIEASRWPQLAIAPHALSVVRDGHDQESKWADKPGAGASLHFLVTLVKKPLGHIEPAKR